MLLTCACGATNRVPSLPTHRLRCGKCKHEFNPAELSKARPEPPPTLTPQQVGDMLGWGVDPTHECKDEDCGWEGTSDELEEGRCPDCNKKVRRIE